jgi:hypothetical protein
VGPCKRIFALDGVIVMFEVPSADMLPFGTLVADVPTGAAFE